jgi:patatin-like phospholipase/acyl hydrolase
MESQPLRILSLDGGGIKGAFAASVLVTFERATRWRFEHFDLITGTSTGGIIAIGRAMGGSHGRRNVLVLTCRREDMHPGDRWMTS